jgi:hypothetical protein
MKKVKKEVIIEELIELRCKRGYSSTSLLYYLKDTHGYEQSRAYDLIKEARTLMGEIYNEINVDALKDSILFMENMKENAIGSGDRKLALDIQKELNKINQLYVEKMQIEHKMEQPLFGAPPKKEENE